MFLALVKIYKSGFKVGSKTSTKFELLGACSIVSLCCVYNYLPVITSCFVSTFFIYKTACWNNFSSIFPISLIDKMASALSALF